MKKILLYITEGFRLFEKKLLLHIFLTVQLALSVLILQYNVVTTENLTANFRMISNIGAKYGVHLYAKTGINWGNVMFETPLDLSGLVGEYSLAESVQYAFSLDSPAGVETTLVQSYNTVLLQKLQAPLARGSWESGCREENGTQYYPIIVNREQGGLSLGDKTLLRRGTEEIPVYIAGVLERDTKYIALQNGSNVPTAEQMIKHCEGNGFYVFFNSDLYPDSIQTARVGALPQRFLYFSESLTDEEYSSNLQYLRNIGWANETSDVLKNTEANLRDTMRYYLPIYVAALLVSIAGLLSFSLLAVYQNLRYHSILLLSGATRGDCIGISVASFVYMALGAILTFFLSLLVSNLLFSMPFSSTSILVAVGACAVSVLPGAIFPGVYLGRHRIAYLMREIL